MNQLINAMKINAEDEERSSSIKYVSIGILQKGVSLNTNIKCGHHILLEPIISKTNKDIKKSRFGKSNVIC